MDNPWNEKTNYIWLKSWGPAQEDRPRMVFFRKSVFLNGKPERAVVRVSADSRYRLSVNGRPVCFGPCKGDGAVWYYEEIDLAPYLEKGENVVAARVLRYPPAHDKGNFSVWRTAVPNFYLTGKVITDTEEADLSAGESWRCRLCEGVTVTAESPYSGYLWNAEQADGKGCLHGFETPGYDDAAWEAALPYRSGQVPRGLSPRSLFPRPIPLLPEIPRRFKSAFCVRVSDIPAAGRDALLREDRPLALAAHSRHVVELDAGELTTGFLELALSGGAGASFTVLTAEGYSVKGPSGRYRREDRENFRHGELVGYSDGYRAAGDGTAQNPELYSPFWFKTFRFIRFTVETAGEPLTLRRFSYRETGYPLEVKTEVLTSDPSFEKIWDISLRTLRRCMHETYEDCPYYEQLQYAMDTRAQILFTYAVSADDRLARKCIDDFHRSLRPDGLTNCCYPSTGPNLIPGFSLYYLFMIYDHMMYFGDKALVERYFPTAERILRYFETRRGPDGLVGRIGGYNGEEANWSFIDWTAQWTWGVPNAIRQGPITMESMLYLLALQKVSGLAAFIGRPEAAHRLSAQAAELKAAIERGCHDPETGWYQDGPGYTADYSQHCQVFAVLAGLAEGRAAAELIGRMLDTPSLTKCSVAMSWYLFRAVEKAGLYEHTQPLWEPWREMLRNHMTTCVESPGDSRSDCHAWGALALFELPQTVLGVRPAAPGFAVASGSPCPGFFTSAQGRVITPRGPISVAWKKENGALRIRCDSTGFDGRVLLPAGGARIDASVAPPG